MCVARGSGRQTLVCMYSLYVFCVCVHFYAFILHHKYYMIVFVWDDDYVHITTQMHLNIGKILQRQVQHMLVFD